MDNLTSESHEFHQRWKVRTCWASSSARRAFRVFSPVDVPLCIAGGIAARLVDHRSEMKRCTERWDCGLSATLSTRKGRVVWAL
jgi:hypothetical protein